MGTIGNIVAKKKLVGAGISFWEIEVKVPLTPGSGESVDPMSPRADILDGTGNIVQHCMLTNQSGNTWISSIHSVLSEPAQAKVRVRFLAAELERTDPFTQITLAAGKPDKEKTSKSKRTKAGAAKKPPQ